ncbi:monocarboxylate transporter 13-like isoform X2 [Patiria miniata]|uniref:Major facilitator superfamily (MFS) profile domain-containing protein n=1 Tax=Patiria miniata TaxID=46514 RepID=A0A914A0U7_PATMI|nr:monocarboxylate transporter 13-like isoform X2 [Patiria miniata]
MTLFLTKYRGWFMVGVVFVELFIVCGPTFNYSIVFVSLQDEFNAGAALTGWVGSLANAVMGAAAPVSSPLIQRFGPRAVTVTGLVVFSGGLVATSFVPALSYAYLTFGLLVGLGANFVFQSGIELLFNWFPDENCSRAISLALLGTSFSVLSFAPLLNSLITAYQWRNALGIIGGGSAVLGLVFGVFISTPAEASPREDGQESRGDDGAESPASQEGENTGTGRQRIVRILLKLDTWLWGLCLLLVYLGWTFVTVNYASFLEHDLLFTKDQVTIAIMLFAVGDIVGKILLSAIGDHLPCLKLYVVVVSSVLGALVSWLMTKLHTVPLVYTVSLFMGSIRSGSYAMPFPATMEIFGEYGSHIVTTLSMMPYGIGILIGAPISE